MQSGSPSHSPSWITTLHYSKWVPWAKHTLGVLEAFLNLTLCLRSDCHSLWICLTVYYAASFMWWTRQWKASPLLCIQKEWAREKRSSPFLPFPLHLPPPPLSVSLSFCLSLSLSFKASPLSLEKIYGSYTHIFMEQLFLEGRGTFHCCLQFPSLDILQPWNRIFLSHPKLF